MKKEDWKTKEDLKIEEDRKMKDNVKMEEICNIKEGWKAEENCNIKEDWITKENWKIKDNLNTKENWKIKENREAEEDGDGKEKLADEQIVALYWERSERAIAESSRKYGRYCGSIAQNILQNPDDAKECVNDTWLAAWNAMPPGKPERLAAFLGKITRNLAIHRCEKNRAKKRGAGSPEVLLEELADCLPDSRTGTDPAEDFVIRDALNRFLAELPAENRKIFVRRYWYFASVKEIAAAYGIGESKVKMRLLRIRKELKQFLEKEEIFL